MAESVVSFLVDKLAILLQQEVRFLRGFRAEVEYIRAELERMRAFLRVADAMEESNEEIRVWVKQVRDIAYDTEDVLDEFMLRLANHHRQGFYTSLRKISGFIKNLNARFRIASEIQGIKSRVHDISEGHRRYNHHGDAVLLEQGSSSTARDNTWYDSRGDALLIEEGELVGIEKPKKQLIKWLVEGDFGLKMVSVVGMGGMGKTTLVKKVYDEGKVKTHFQNHAWINVSQSFKLEDLLRDMIQQLYREIRQPVPQGVETMNSQGLKTIINEFLQQSRYILVLDDVWSINDWNAFKYALPKNNRGGRIMLTTRIREVAAASSIESQGNVYVLNPLSPEDSWTLFCRKTFYEDFCPSHLEEVSKGILKRCEGLPIAIVAVSGVLATKDKNRIDEWEMVRKSLGVELEGDDRFKSMTKILSLSYDDLPYYLKSCFLYFSIFPEDHLIECIRLIRLWIAEGFVGEKEGRTREEVAESYLNQLLSRSLIQVAKTTVDGRVRLCRIHDLLREFIVLKSKDQNFVAIANERTGRWPEKVRRISVHNSWRKVQEHENIYNLRSLLMFRKVDSLSSSSMLSFSSSGLRLLKVLDLRGAPLDAFPNEITELFHLTYLSLRHTKVEMLPSTIGKLQNLETLDLKHTHVTELPVEILTLLQLRHLLVYDYHVKDPATIHSIQSFEALPGIGGLLSLQKLNYIKANEGSGDLMGEIGRLSQLRRLGITNLRRDDGVALCSSIEKLSNLRSLSVNSDEECEIIDLQHLHSPPPFLRSLHLTGRLEKIPHWIRSLQSLVIVGLRWSQLKDDPLEDLGALPNLMELKLIHAFYGTTLCFKAGGFPRLKLFFISEFKGLQQMEIEEGGMPNLEELNIRHCELLKRVPSGIERLTKLNILRLNDMPDEFVKTVKLNEGEDYWKVAHIPKVSIGYVKNGRWTEYFL